MSELQPGPPTDHGRPRLHHAHLMASDVQATIDFWRDCFDARLVADEAMAGTRNVFLDIGGSRLNLYAKAPNQRGPVNHLGVQVADLEATVARLRAAGWTPRPIKVDGALGYSMVEGPDGLLLEVFHFDRSTTPDHLRPYFDLPPNEPAPADSNPAPGGSNPVPAGSNPVPAGRDTGLSGMGAGLLSPEAVSRLARPTQPPLDPPPLDDPAAVVEFRSSIHQAWLDGDPSASECGHREAEIGGVRCLRAGPDRVDEADADRADPLMVYFHGGGYVLGSPEVSLPITERLAADCEVVSVDYRLAPEHPYPAAADDGLSVVTALARTGAIRPLVLAGDSAGANIALSVARSLIADDGARIAGLILLCPHLDHRPRPTGERADPLSDVDDRTAAWLSAAYRGDRSVDDPGLSPLLADLSNLPPTLVQVGTVDATFDDSVRFARLARAVGVEVVLDVWHGLWHTWHYHRELPEAAQALAEAARFATGTATA